MVLILGPNLWLAVQGIRTNRRLLREVERGRLVEAALLSERLLLHASRILYEEERLEYVQRPAAGGAAAYPLLISPAGSGAMPGQTRTGEGRAPDARSGAGPPGVMPSSRRHDEGEPVYCIQTMEAWGGAAGDTVAVIQGAKADAARVRREVLPQAFQRLAEEVRAEGRDLLARGVLGFEVAMPETTIVLSTAPRPQGRTAPGPGFTSPSFTLGEPLPGWSAHILYLSDARERSWPVYLAHLLPLLLVVGGVAIAAHAARREVAQGQAMSVFVSSVTHELKTPLTKIRFFNEMLQRIPEQAEEKRAHYHHIIGNECERLALLIDNVLDFNRIERGQMRYEFVEVPVEEVITEVADTYRVLLAERGYAIDLQLEDDLPVVALDPLAFKQALMNLIDNAVKYSAPHVLVVRARRVREQAQDGVEIVVQDRGIGIPADQLHLIFEEFYRVEEERTRHVSGSGLGLALVRHIVEGHGGQIRVESTLGAGSGFTISLPLRTPKKRKSK